MRPPGCAYFAVSLPLFAMRLPCPRATELQFRCIRSERELIAIAKRSDFPSRAGNRGFDIVVPRVRTERSRCDFGPSLRCPGSFTFPTCTSGAPYVPEAGEALQRIVPVPRAGRDRRERGPVAARQARTNSRRHGAFSIACRKVPMLVIPGNHDVPLYRVAERLLKPHELYRERDHAGPQSGPHARRASCWWDSIRPPRAAPSRTAGCIAINWNIASGSSRRRRRRRCGSWWPITTSRRARITCATGPCRRRAAPSIVSSTREWR